MAFWIYLLRCADGTFYVGQTDDLEKRISAHQSGELDGYTSSRIPIELVFSETFPTRVEALAREQQIKGWSRKKKEALINRDWGEISRYSRSKGAAE